MTFRFNIDQPRDPDGKFANGGGLPNVLSTKALSLGGKSGSLESKPSGHTKVTLGGHSASIPNVTGRKTLADLDHFGGNAELTVAGDGGKPAMKLKFGSYVEEPDGSDESGAPAQLSFLDGNGKETGTTNLSMSEVKTFAKDYERVSAASRIKTFMGATLDTFLDGNGFGFRTVDGEKTFTPREYRRLSDAIEAVYEGVDESGDYGPEGAAVTELAVKTAAGKLIVSRDGNGGANNKPLITVSTVSSDWGFTFATVRTGDDDHFFDAVERLEESADVLGFYVRTAGRPVQSRHHTPPVRSHDMMIREAAQARAAAVRQRGDRPSQRRCAETASSRSAVRAHLDGVQLRNQASSGDLEFIGHASMTERAYEMWDFFGPYTETVGAGAFDETLIRTGLDVPLVLGHDQMRRIARTTNGTLALAMDADGLAVRATLDPDDIDVQYIAPKLRSGLIDEMSFAFRIDAGTWSPDYSEYRIEKVDIHRGDVAIVGYGANPHTDGTVRASGDKARAMLALAVALG